MHYGHQNICKGTSSWDWKSQPDSVRDFDTLSQMNDKIVDNINDVVKHDDTLIHIGDWSFGGFEKISEFRSRIICQNIILILGNHDHHIKKNKENIKDFFIHTAIMEEIEIAKKLFVFCHFPLEHWIDEKKGTYMIHGHLHSPSDKRLGKGRKMDVGLDGHPEFRPYHIDEIFELLRSRSDDDDYHK